MLTSVSNFSQQVQQWQQDGVVGTKTAAGVDQCSQQGFAATFADHIVDSTVCT